MRPRQIGIGQRELRIQPYRFLIHPDLGPLGGVSGAALEILIAPEEKVVGLEIPGWRGFHGSALLLQQRNTQGLNHLVSNIRLDPKDFVQWLVVDLRPQVSAVLSVDQLWRNSDPGRTFG